MERITKARKNLLLSIFMCTNAFSNEESSNPWSYAVGSECQYYNYREPRLMHFIGWMLGVNGEATYLSSNNLFTTIDIRILGGNTDYSSYEAGKMAKVPNLMSEIRSLIGHKFQLRDNSTLSTYTGLGYRFKQDGSAAKRTTTAGYLSYKRQSHYLYLPIGIKYKFSLNADFDLSIRGEVDVLLKGQQKYNYPFVGNISNDQNWGLGWKANFDLIKKVDNKRALSVGPYLHCWRIADSKVEKGLLEPHNKTYEAGISIKYHF